MTMHDLVIVGAGGFAHEVHGWLWDVFSPEEYRFKGFLGRREDCQSGNTVVKWLADPESYSPEPDDRFILAVGDLSVRLRLTETLTMKRARFVNFVHPTAVIAATAKLGTGAVVYPFATVSNGAELGEFVHLSLYASVGHNARVGDNCYLSPYATLNGGSRIGSQVFMGSHSAVGPGVLVAEESTVCANSCVLRSVPANSFVLGVPGRAVSRVEFEQGP